MVWHRDQWHHYYLKVELDRDSHSPYTHISDVGEEWSASVSIHIQYKSKSVRAYVCLNYLADWGLSTIELLPVPGNLKDRSARFGYIIGDALQRNYYQNMGTEDMMEEEDYRDRYTEEAIVVRRAIRLTKCATSVLSFKTGKPREVALFTPLHLTILNIFTDASPLSRHWPNSRRFCS